VPSTAIFLSVVSLGVQRGVERVDRVSVLVRERT
jgi:hypothetical protein